MTARRHFGSGHAQYAESPLPVSRTCSGWFPAPLVFVVVFDDGRLSSDEEDEFSRPSPWSQRIGAKVVVSAGSLGARLILLPPMGYSMSIRMHCIVPSLVPRTIQFSIEFTVGLGTQFHQLCTYDTVRVLNSNCIQLHCTEQIYGCAACTVGMFMNVAGRAIVQCLLPLERGPRCQRRPS